MIDIATPIAAPETAGEVERSYHGLRQILRLSGAPLNARGWTAFERGFPVIWREMQRHAGLPAFAPAADELRAEAARLAQAFAGVETVADLAGQETPPRPVPKALELYHDLTPKLLLFASAVRRACESNSPNGRSRSALAARRMGKGGPRDLRAMEPGLGEPEEQRLRDLFEDIQTTLSLAALDSQYRALALWLDFLAAGWQRLQPVCQSAQFQHAADWLRQRSRALAKGLPPAIALSPEAMRQLGDDPDAVGDLNRCFEQALPPLVLSIALLRLDVTAAARGHSQSDPPFGPSAPNRAAYEPQS